MELLFFDGCPGHEAVLPRLRALVERVAPDEQIELRRIDTVAAAEAERFLGSPTVRVDGRDIEPDAQERTDFGLKCRLYATPEGLRGQPPDALVLAALAGQ